MNLWQRRVLCVFAAGIVSLCGALSVRGQGAFENLDFEAARIIPVEPEPFPQFYIATSNALPGWNASVPYLVYDTISLGGVAISIHDKDSSWGVWQGNYSISMQNSFDGRYLVSIWQTGLIPDWAQSLQFLIESDPGFEVTLGGQLLPIELISDRRWGANIGVFAGKTLELKFEGTAFLDAITFSPELIPEPAASALLLLGGGLISIVRKYPFPKPKF